MLEHKNGILSRHLVEHFLKTFLKKVIFIIYLSTAKEAL
jgi:hypothetical protein